MDTYHDPHIQKSLRLQMEEYDPRFPRMKKLKIKGKDLGELPKELFLMTYLEVLELSPERQSCLFFKLTKIPPEIGKLSNLRVLVLDTNDISELPHEIGALRNLERLYISNNSLSSLPEAFTKLQKLESLHLANNEFPEFPTQLLALEKLEFLDLSDNKILSIPSGISNLRNLHTLILFVNKISIIPDELCKLVNLRSLWLGNNNIEKLPRTFVNLKHIDWGKVHTPSSAIDGNPMTNPPLDICKEGIEAIREYFERDENKKT